MRCIQLCRGGTFSGRAHCPSTRIFEWRDLWPWFDNQIEHAEQDSCPWHLDFRTLLHASCVIVGRLRSTTQSANESKVEGIFCMSKRPDVVVRYAMLKNEPFILSVKYSCSPETLVGLRNFGCAASWTIACLKGRICFLWLVINAHFVIWSDIVWFLVQKKNARSTLLFCPITPSLVVGRLADSLQICQARSLLNVANTISWWPAICVL